MGGEESIDIRGAGQGEAVGSWRGGGRSREEASSTLDGVWSTRNPGELIDVTRCQECDPTKLKPRSRSGGQCFTILDEVWPVLQAFDAPQFSEFQVSHANFQARYDTGLGRMLPVGPFLFVFQLAGSKTARIRGDSELTRRREPPPLDTLASRPLFNVNSRPSVISGHGLLIATLRPCIGEKSLI